MVLGTWTTKSRSSLPLRSVPSVQASKASKMPSVYMNTDFKPLTALPPRNPDVKSFHQSLPLYHPTPLVSLPDIAQQLGIQYLLVKDESSRLGLPAFKILGASWATARAVAKHVGLETRVLATLEKTENDFSLKNLASAAQTADIALFAATDGNHGRAVACMAKDLGIKARIFVPSMVDEETKSKIASEGAFVEVVDGSYDQTVIATKLACDQHEGGKGLLISDTALEIEDEIPQWIVEGYQTMFDEIEEQVREATGRQIITQVVVPVGAGSLACAAVHFSTPRSPKPDVITVEPESAACLKASLEAGKMTSVHTTYTICTGMCCGTLSASVWPILREGVKIASTVNDQEVDKAIRTLQKYNISAGPCGAASFAAIQKLAREEGIQLGPNSVVVILCTEAMRGYELRV